MSALKPGTLCVIVGGCPENIGLVVRVIAHLGRHLGRADAYLIETASGRFFNQLTDADGTKLRRGSSSEAITDRHKLRPLVPSDDSFITHTVEEISETLLTEHTE